MKSTKTRMTLGALALATLGLSPLAANAGFCPLDMFTGNPGGCSQSGGGQDTCPTRRPDDLRRQYLDILSRIEGRQERQLGRIHQGVEQGALNARETEKLMREEWYIERMQRRFLSDGFLSREEWHVLNTALDQASQDIRQEVRDDDWNG
jgi:hypothetical protein